MEKSITDLAIEAKRAEEDVSSTYAAYREALKRQEETRTALSNATDAEIKRRQNAMEG